MRVVLLPRLSLLLSLVLSSLAVRLLQLPPPLWRWICWVCVSISPAGTPQPVPRNLRCPAPFRRVLRRLLHRCVEREEQHNRKERILYQ